MNKFNRLQLLGTLVIISPALLAIGGAVVLTFNTSEKVETEAVTVEVETPKVDTVTVVKEVPAPAPPPAPVVKKPTPPPSPAPEPPKVVKDTAIEVELKVAAELDTTK